MSAFMLDVVVTNNLFVEFFKFDSILFNYISFTLFVSHVDTSPGATTTTTTTTTTTSPGGFGEVETKKNKT